MLIISIISMNRETNNSKDPKVVRQPISRQRLTEPDQREEI